MNEVRIFFAFMNLVDDEMRDIFIFVYLATNQTFQ